MIPRVGDEVLRPCHSNGAFRSNELGKLKCLMHNLVAATRYHLRHEPELVRLRGGERARGVRELAQQRVVARDLREERERADVRRQPDVDLLRSVGEVCKRCPRCPSRRARRRRTLMAKLVFAAA